MSKIICVILLIVIAVGVVLACDALPLDHHGMYQYFLGLAAGCVSMVLWGIIYD